MKVIKIRNPLKLKKGSKSSVDLIEVSHTEIAALLPHRYPMLLVDKVIDMILDESAVGVKNVTVNEPFFMGHFPNQPVMPGVLIVEAMGQTAGVLAMLTMGLTAEGKVVYFTTIENVRFRRPVLPGDTLLMKVRKLKRRQNLFWKFEGIAEVNGEVVAEAIYSAVIVEESESETETES